jgi:hypothetical protein
MAPALNAPLVHWLKALKEPVKTKRAIMAKVKFFFMGLFFCLPLLLLKWLKEIMAIVR